MAHLPTDAQDAAQTAPGTETPTPAPAPAHDAPADSSAPSDEAAPDDLDETADTFPRAVVEKLRKEAASLRDRLRDAEARATSADDLRAALHAARIKADGRLIDPDALPYTEGLDSDEAVTEAIGTLLGAKPYLSAARFGGAIPQGRQGEPVNEAPGLHSLLLGRRL